MALARFIRSCEAISARLLTLDPEIVAPLCTDWTRRVTGEALGLVRPSNEFELAAVVEAAADAGVHLHLQGGNTSLVAGATPWGDSVLLSTARLRAVGEPDLTSQCITAEAGATAAEVNSALAPHRLKLGVDLASRESATIGGMVATNAGGIHVVRYGSMRTQLLGVRLVTPAHGAIGRLSPLYKDNTGPDLAAIAAGSEGTLGVVAAAALKAVPILDEGVVALLSFGSFPAAAEGARRIRRSPVVSALEFMTHSGMDLVSRHLGRALPLAGAVYLLVEFESAFPLLDHVAEVVEDSAPSTSALAFDTRGRAELWRWREAHTEAIAAAGVAHKMDVALPISALEEFVAWVEGPFAADNPELDVYLFGHLGDGNVHVNLVGAEPDDFSPDEAVLAKAASMGGSISAEHGIGRLKASLVHLVRSPAEIEAMTALKAAFDPDGILNPGVLLPTPKGRHASENLAPGRLA
ncbi:MAG: FAD-binding oxidoreductase [Nitrospiraceae bacterium]|nr:FAD-binding oxidoreductase [Nitrospiraceae bacterium]